MRFGVFGGGRAPSSRGGVGGADVRAVARILADRAGVRRRARVLAGRAGLPRRARREASAARAQAVERGATATRAVRGAWVGVLLVLALAAPVAVGAAEYANQEGGYTVDVPVDWEVMDASRADHVSFVDPRGIAVFQILTFPASQFETAQGIADFVSERFEASGDKAPFSFSGHEAIFADLTFNTGRFDVRGYHVFINGGQYDYALMSFTGTDYYEQYHDFLLSAVDSFKLARTGRRVPGPVSQFYHAFPAPNPQEQTAQIGPARITYRMDPNEQDATQVLIEREARILSQYAQDGNDRWSGGTELWQEAWRRYYRVIYRDNFPRLKNLADSIHGFYRSARFSRAEIPPHLLGWLQSFEYSRTGTLSDLLSPVSCTIQQAGDCDALGLTYAILLEHLGYDAILLVSSEYQHALAGVDVDGPGARFDFEGTKYLLAEMTEEVDLGQIPANMADPNKWIGVQVGE